MGAGARSFSLLGQGICCGAREVDQRETSGVLLRYDGLFKKLRGDPLGLVNANGRTEVWRKCLEEEV